MVECEAATISSEGERAVSHVCDAGFNSRIEVNFCHEVSVVSLREHRDRGGAHLRLPAHGNYSTRAPLTVSKRPFTIVNVRIQPDDRTSRAIIRDTALRLFADSGVDGVTVRQIAAAARVSPALVIRHFGSEEGLREEADTHVVRTIEEILKILAERRSPTPDNLQSVAEAVVTHLASDSPIPTYIGRLLLDRGRAGRHLFRRLFEVGRATLSELQKAGLAAPGADPRVRAAFLMANDLAVLLLREHLTELLGVDPLSAAGIKRWAGEVLAIYSSGLGAVGAVPLQKTGTPQRPKHLSARGRQQGGKHQ